MHWGHIDGSNYAREPEIFPVRDGSVRRISYDYWAVRSIGDFYLLQSLFEDYRGEPNKQIFFDTRIVRVTESLMFAENLYTNLGAPPETRVAIRISHEELKCRTLTSASRYRYVNPSVTEEDVSISEFVTV